MVPADFSDWIRVFVTTRIVSDVSESQAFDPDKIRKALNAHDEGQHDNFRLLCADAF